MRMMQDDRNEGRAICLYSSPDERLKSAAACLLATYFVGVLSSLSLASLTEIFPRRSSWRNKPLGKHTSPSRNSPSSRSEMPPRGNQITGLGYRMCCGGPGRRGRMGLWRVMRTLMSRRTRWVSRRE